MCTLRLDSKLGDSSNPFIGCCTFRLWTGYCRKCIIFWKMCTSAMYSRKFELYFRKCEMGISESLKWVFQKVWNGHFWKWTLHFTKCSFYFRKCALYFRKCISENVHCISENLSARKHLFIQYCHTCLQVMRQCCMNISERDLSLLGRNVLMYFKVCSERIKISCRMIPI